LVSDFGFAGVFDSLEAAFLAAGLRAGFFLVVFSSSGIWI
jgi:hypothetical protein